MYYFIDRKLTIIRKDKMQIFWIFIITCIDASSFSQTSSKNTPQINMFGSQMKWAKFLSANLPKVEETGQNNEKEKEEVILSIFTHVAPLFEWLTL